LGIHFLYVMLAGEMRFMQSKLKRFAVSKVAVAVAGTIVASTALAAPTPNQMPGAGVVVAKSLGSSGTSWGDVGSPLVNLISGNGIGIDGKIVIRWGGAGAPVDATNPQGFNLGANAQMFFGAISSNAAVLNIDASGNASQIYGTLVATASPIGTCGVCSYAPALYVANANGIVVGAGGRIVAPAGVGLLGANLDNTTSIADFVGNNGWTSPSAPTLGTSYITFDALPTVGATPGLVEIGGSINGDLATNTPAKYILIAGNNAHVTNTGNLFGGRAVIDAGVMANATQDSVNGVSNVAVHRLWSVDGGNELALGGLGVAPPWFMKAGPDGNGNIVNEGSIAASSSINEPLVLQGTGNIISGTPGSTDTLVGIFSDNGVFIESMSDTGTVALYNVVAGYSTPLQFLYINAFATNAGNGPNATSRYANVVIDTITPGAQPSGITTTTEIGIYGRDITIDSTINDKLPAQGGIQENWELTLNALSNLTVNADIGAGSSVRLTAGGDMTIAGNVVSDTNLDGDGAIIGTGGSGLTAVSGDLTAMGLSDITFQVHNTTVFSGTVTTNWGNFIVGNTGTGAGNSTTISGDVFSGGGVFVTQSLSPLNTAPIVVDGDIVADGNVAIDNAGAALGNATLVSGGVTSNFGNVAISNTGLLTGRLDVAGPVSAAGLASFTSDGNAKIGEVSASSILATVLGLNLEVNGPWTAATAASIVSPLATTTFTPDGVVQAPAVTLAGLTFRGVDADGAAYASDADKPEAQFVTNILTVTLAGNINAPIADNTDWPQNSIDVAPLVTLAPVLVSVTANGGGFQAVNLHVLGNAVFDTGGTTTPFIGVPLTTGGFPSGGLQGNLGSQLIMQADGALTIIGTPTGSLTGPATAAQWPGGAAFIAGTTLQLLTPFYNAWTTQSPAFGGSFFTAPVIALNGYIATSGTAWANFSTQPVTGNPTVYQIRQLGTNAFGFAATEAFVKNDYMSTVAGGPVCVVTGPGTWSACP